MLIKLQSDKGSNTTKISFLIDNIITPNSIFSFTLLVLFEANENGCKGL